MVNIVSSILPPGDLYLYFYVQEKRCSPKRSYALSSRHHSHFSPFLVRLSTKCVSDESKSMLLMSAFRPESVNPPGVAQSRQPPLHLCPTFKPRAQTAFPLLASSCESV